MEMQRELRGKNTTKVIAQGWLDSTPVSRKPYGEPIKEEFFYASDQANSQVKIIRRWRKSIQKPMQYEIIDGRLKFDLVKIRFPKKEISRLLNQESLLQGGEQSDFIDMLNAIISSYKSRIGILIRNHKISELKESEHPLIAFLGLTDELGGGLGKEIIADIFYNIGTMFPHHAEELKNFLIKHRDIVLKAILIRKFTLLVQKK